MDTCKGDHGWKAPLGDRHAWDPRDPLDILYISRSGKHLQYKSYSYMTQGSPPRPQPMLTAVITRISGQEAHKGVSDLLGLLDAQK